MYQKKVLWYDSLILTINNSLFLGLLQSLDFYVFSGAFWFNIMTLCTFFNASIWFNACFKFLMFKTHSFVSFKLATSFSFFASLSFLQTKRVNYFEVHVNFWDIIHQLQGNFLLHYLHCSFLWNTYIQLRFIFSTLKTTSTYFLQHAHPYKLFTSQNFRYKDFLFL